MTYTTVHHAVMNEQLQDRVTAAVMKEVWASPTFQDTDYGRQLMRAPVTGPIWHFMWPVSIHNEASYQYALEVAVNNTPPGEDVDLTHLGIDQGIISDAAILDAVQQHWPEDVPGGPNL